MAKKIISIGKRGVVYMPKEVLNDYNLHEGDYLEITESSGAIVLKPKALIDKDQEWFWSKEWQKGEKAADEDIKKGKVKKFKSAGKAAVYLKKLRKK